MSGRKQRSRKSSRRTQRCPLLVGLRQMTITEMVPGYEYAPGLSVLTIQTHPVFGEHRDAAVIFQVPVMLKPEHRTPTDLNVRIALATAEAVDPEAAAVIEKLKMLARSPRSRAYAARLQR